MQMIPFVKLSFLLENKPEKGRFLRNLADGLSYLDSNF